MKPKSNRLTLIAESFMSGIFGQEAKVPWDGPTPEVPNLLDQHQITTETNGQEIYIVGGGMLSSPQTNSEANSKISAARIRTYRQMQYYTEVTEAIENVINDVITSETDEDPITLNLDKLDTPDKIKDRMRESFKKISKLLQLRDHGYDVFRQFYVDGKRAYQIVLNKNKKKGIARLVAMDSASIRPARFLEVERDHTGIEFIKSERRTFIFNDYAGMSQGINTWAMSVNQHKILEMDPESVAYADSGLLSADGRFIVGFLEPAIKPANNLRTVEDGNVIYAITRAIDKRAFFLDVGDLPKKSAEEYMVKTMNRFKTKLNFNSETGEIDRNKTNISMVEDLWLPRREGQTATEISTLEAGKNVGEINHLQYHKEKLYTSLLIPKSRISGDTLVNIGGSDLAQVSREEWRFAKMCARIRKKFSPILKQCLKVELIQTGVMTLAEWESIEDDIVFDFASDSYIKEQQENELFMARMNMLKEAEPYVGKLFSIQTVRRKLLQMSEEQIEDEDKLINEERDAGAYDDYGETPLKMKSQLEVPTEFDEPASEPASEPEEPDLENPISDLNV